MKRNFSEFQTKSSWGRDGGNFNIRNHNHNNHKGKTGSNCKGIKVDGMWITNRYFKDFAKLAPKEKDAICELKKDPNFENKTTISGMNANSDGYSNHAEPILIVNTIINAIERAFSVDATSESDTDTTINNWTKALARLVGCILMNRRRGDIRWYIRLLTFFQRHKIQ